MPQRRFVVELNSRRFAPQPLERVELSCVRREDVDDEVEVIEQDPLRALVALDVSRSHLDGLETFLDGIGNGMYLSRVGARADQEVVGEGTRLSQIKNGDVRGLPGFLPLRWPSSTDSANEASVAWRAVVGISPCKENSKR